MTETTQIAERREAVSHRAILAIAVPIMISNVSTPLLGIVDTGVVGQIPDPAYIGAVALGALVFNFVFWCFGFLRMGTSGLTAQALGAADAVEIRASLGRAVLIALIVGTALIALQWPIRELAFALINGSPKVEALARDYYDIRIWAAPATLLNYALLGWFVGLSQARVALLLQLILNLTNMGLDMLFVLGLDMDVKGVALGTVIAEVLAATVGLAIAARHLRGLGGRWDFARLAAPGRIGRTIAVNRDIMIRSAALIFVYAWFMARARSRATRCWPPTLFFIRRFWTDRVRCRGAGGQGSGCRRPGGIRRCGAHDDLVGGRDRVAGILILCACRQRVHRSAHGRRSRARNCTRLSALGGRSASRRGMVLPARRHLHRRHPHRGHAQRDARVACDLSGRLVGPDAVRQPWLMGIALRSLRRAHRDALLLPSRIGTLGAFIPAPSVRLGLAGTLQPIWNRSLSHATRPSRDAAILSGAKCVIRDLIRCPRIAEDLSFEVVFAGSISLTVSARRRHRSHFDNSPTRHIASAGLEACRFCATQITAMGMRST
jgi:hypothetical protein